MTAREWFTAVRYEARLNLAIYMLRALLRVLPAGPKRLSLAKCIQHSACFGLAKHK